MEISYTVPLRRAWQRMQAMLFRPFHLEHWLVIGFAAFVARLPETGGGLFGWRNQVPLHRTWTPEARHAFQSARDGLMVLLDKPAVLLAIALALVLVGALLLVMTWLGARGRLVYLENVAEGRAAFVAPWHRLGRLGNSLFLWYAAFGFTALLPITAVALPFAPTIAHLVQGQEFVWPAFGAIALGAAIAALLALVLLLVTFFTREFVEPLMLLYDETASRAWGRFWPLLSAHLGEFIAYALFIALVWVAVAVALLFAGVATCCIGLALMLIPYVGTVLLLPVEVTARACGPEFMAQFGPEWDLFAKHRPQQGQPDVPLPPG